MERIIRVLLIEANQGDADLIQEMLSLTTCFRYEFACVSKLSSAIDMLYMVVPDVVLLNLELPDSEGVQAVESIIATAPGVPCVVLTGDDNRELGLAAVKAGAQDFLTKRNISGDLLTRVINYAIERCEAQRKLRVSENILSSALDSFSAHIVIVDGQGTILRVNRAWRSFVRENGLTVQHACEGENYFSIYGRITRFEAASVSAFLAGVKTVLEGDASFFEMEYPYQGPESECWFNGRVNSFPHRVSTPQAVIAHENITRKKRGELVLQANERQLRAIFDSSPNIILVKDENGRYLQANKAAENFHGVTHEEILGKTDLELKGLFSLSEQDLEYLKSTDEKARRQKGRLLLPVNPSIDHNGEIHWLKWVKTLIDLPEQPGCILSIGIDVSEQHRMEVEARDAEIRMRTILDNIRNKIVLLDKELRIVWANKLACDLAEKDQEEITGKYCHEVWQHGHLLCSSCPVRVCAEKMEVRSTTRTLDDGSTWRITGCPVTNSEGELVGVVEVSEDISRRMKIESQIWQSQKMESLGTLAGGIAHDFNNILTAILGFTDLCLSRTNKEGELYEDLKEVYQAGVRAKELVSQILTFSRRVDISHQPLQPNLVIKEVLKLLRSTLPASIEFKLWIKGSKNYISADPTQIHQIVMNLCTNAASAMGPDGGVLEVRVDDVELRTTDLVQPNSLNPGTYFRLRISDTGCGMSPEVMASIFDPYFTTKELGEGTGLGLSVVHGIVTESGGDVQVHSVVGAGSEFTVLLPIVEISADEQSAHVAEPENYLPTGTEHILVVDDEPPILTMTKRILEQNGYRVTTCSDPLIARERVKQSADEYDLVLSDVTMPRLTGDRLAEAIKEVRPDLPVVLMTGYSNIVTPEFADSTGVMDIIYKPLGRSTLVKLVRKYLDRVPMKRGREK